MSFNNYRVDSIHTHGVVESDLTLSEATKLAQRLANEDGHTYCVCTNGGSPRQYVYPTPAETPTAEDGTLPIGTPVKVTKATYYRGEPVTSVFNGVIESVRKDGRGYTVTVPGISGMAHYVDFKEVEAI